MADDHIADLLLEAQQHDSIRRLNYRFELQRRDFFKDSRCRVAGAWARHAVGSVEQGRASASKTLAQTYTLAYIAHAPLEPRAACRRARAPLRSLPMVPHGQTCCRVDFFKMAISIRESLDYRSLLHMHS